MLAKEKTSAEDERSCAIEKVVETVIKKMMMMTPFMKKTKLKKIIIKKGGT